MKIYSRVSCFHKFYIFSDVQSWLADLHSCDLLYDEENGRDEIKAINYFIYLKTKNRKSKERQDSTGEQGI